MEFLMRFFFFLFHDVLNDVVIFVSKLHHGYSRSSEWQNRNKKNKMK